MVRYVYLFTILLLVFSCRNVSRGNEDGVIRLSLLKGPSAIAFAQWLEKPPTINGKAVLISLVDSPDIIQAGLIKKETDMAVLPMLSAANLYNKGISFRLLGCPLWGTLYWLGRESDHNNKELHVFGTGTTPDILSRYYIDREKLTYSLNYSFGTATEVLQAMLARKVQMAVLSEPFVSMALQKDSSLHVLTDLNNPEDKLMPGFPQTAIVYSPILEDDISVLDSLLQVSCRFAVEHPDEAIRILEQKKIFPKGMLTAEGIERCKVYYRTAADAKESIYSFLRLVEQYEPKAIGNRLPDAGFIPEQK